MQKPRVYIATTLTLRNCCCDLISLMAIDPHLSTYDPKLIHCQDFNRLPKGRILPDIHSFHGPLIIFGSINEKDLIGIRESLDELVPIESIFPVDEFEALEQVRLIISRFERGEPFLPRKYVVALLVIAKLYKLNIWGGNSKGYLWSGDLPKGRGISSEMEPHVLEVANLLRLNDWLISKKSCGKTKYALNSSKRREIAEIIETFKISDVQLRSLLLRDQSTASKDHLSQLRKLCNADNPI